MRHKFLSHVRHLAVFGVFAATVAGAQPVEPLDPRGSKCFADQVRSLDDDKSDARTIAAAVVAMCRDGRFQAMKIRSPQVRDDIINRALDGLRDQDIDGVAAVVLSWRSRAHKP